MIFDYELRFVAFTWILAQHPGPHSPIVALTEIKGRQNCN